MVSVFVPPPWDQDRIFSGLARRILIASKSSMDRPGSRLGLIGIITLIVPTDLSLALPSVLGLDQLDVQAEALELPDEHVERLGDARGVGGVALHEGLVDLGPAVDVVRLRGQELLEDVGGAVGLEGPHLHLAEALAAELRLAPERPLCDER